MSQEKTVSSESVFSGRIISVRVDRVTLPNGRVTTREIVEHRGAVAIVAVHEENVVLVKQYRKPVEEELLEIPAGTIEEGESPHECAKRELSEEVGLYPLDLKEIFKFYSSPGFCNEMLYLYLATTFEEKKQHTDEDEFIKVERVPLKDIPDMLKAGVFKDSKTLVGLLYLVSNGVTKI